MRSPPGHASPTAEPDTLEATGEAVVPTLATTTPLGAVVPSPAEEEPAPLLTELADRFPDWPIVWRQYVIDLRKALERDAWLSAEEALARACTRALQDYRTLLLPRTLIADRVATALGYDLQAASTHLGYDVRTLPDEDLRALQHSLQETPGLWPGWSAVAREDLTYYLAQYQEECARQQRP